MGGCGVKPVARSSALQLLRVQKILWTAGRSLVLNEVRSTNTRHGQSGVRRNLPILPGGREIKTRHQHQDIYSSGWHANLVDVARLCEVGVSQTLKWSAESCERCEHTAGIGIRCFDPNVQALRESRLDIQHERIAADDEVADIKVVECAQQIFEVGVRIHPAPSMPPRPTPSARPRRRWLRSLAVAGIRCRSCDPSLRDEPCGPSNQGGAFGRYSPWLSGALRPSPPSESTPAADRPAGSLPQWFRPRPPCRWRPPYPRRRATPA